MNVQRAATKSIITLDLSYVMFSVSFSQFVALCMHCGPMTVGDCTSSVLVYLWLVMLVFSGSVMLQGCSSSEDGLLSQHGTSHWVFLHIKDTDQFFYQKVKYQNQDLEHRSHHVYVWFQDITIKRMAIWFVSLPLAFQVKRSSVTRILLF